MILIHRSGKFTDFLVSNYGSALYNLVELEVKKCLVIYEINATKMADHPLLASPNSNSIASSSTSHMLAFSRICRARISSG